MMSETSSSVGKPVRLRIASLSSNSWIKASRSREDYRCKTLLGWPVRLSRNGTRRPMYGSTKPSDAHWHRDPAKIGSGRCYIRTFGEPNRFHLNSIVEVNNKPALLTPRATPLLLKHSR